MFKKFVATAVAFGVLAGSSIAASATPMAFNSANRASSPVDGAQEADGFSEVWLAVIFALIAAGIIVLIEDNEGDVADLPTSP